MTAEALQIHIGSVTVKIHPSPSLSFHWLSARVNAQLLVIGLTSKDYSPSQRLNSLPVSPQNSPLLSTALRLAPCATSNLTMSIWIWWIASSEGRFSPGSWDIIIRCVTKPASYLDYSKFVYSPASAHSPVLRCHWRPCAKASFLQLHQHWQWLQVQIVRPNEALILE